MSAATLDTSRCSLHCASCPSGRVIAFEPSPTNAAQFRQNMDVNGDLSAVVTLNELAVADTPGVARFTRGKNSYVGHLADTASGETFDVQVTTLDRFASASNLWPDFVKVDAEGAEPRIFAGMQDVLRRKRPTLLTELHDEAGYGAFCALLREHRYVSRRIESHESLSDHPVWQPEAEYLALPSERHI
ncbi:MAG: FkbM family methyltransferase [Vicinamibacterales bacterium]